MNNKGISIDKLSKIPESEMKKLIKEGFAGLVDDLAAESQKWWNSVIVPTIPLVTAGLVSSKLSPLSILQRKKKEVLEKMKVAQTQAEKNKCDKLLARYNALENYAKSLWYYEWSGVR